MKSNWSTEVVLLIPKCILLLYWLPFMLLKEERNWLLVDDEHLLVKSFNFSSSYIIFSFSAALLHIKAKESSLSFVLSWRFKSVVSVNYGRVLSLGGTDLSFLYSLTFNWLMLFMIYFFGLLSASTSSVFSLETCLLILIFFIVCCALLALCS